MAHVANWRGPTEYTDGTAFGESDLAGWLITVDGAPAVNVPMAWNESNLYSFDLTTLGISYGAHVARIQTVARNGSVSAPSNAVNFTHADERVPGVPFDLTVDGLLAAWFFLS
jgi:hypothetical protein